MTAPDFMIWHCAGCGAPAEGKKKPCDCATNIGTREGPNGARESTWWDDELARIEEQIVGVASDAFETAAVLCEKLAAIQPADVRGYYQDCADTIRRLKS